MFVILAALNSSSRTLWKTSSLQKKCLCFPVLPLSIFWSYNNTFITFGYSSTMDSFSKFGLYRNLKEILADLEEHRDKQQVEQLLKIFDQAKIKNEEQSSGLAKNPLVILEGLDGSGKTSMTKQLAKKCRAERRCTPPESIRVLRDYFDKELTLRSAYYSLGNYIAALEILCELPKHAVVMDRYWHSTTAYALAQGVANRPSELELPSPSDEIYEWPEDLLKPDKVIFLNVSEEMRLERHSRRAAALVTTQENLLKDDVKFRGDVIQAYKNMRDPAVTIIDGDGSFGVTLWKLRNNLKPLLENVSGNV